MTMHRAYSLIECKDVSEDQRIIRGIATSPVPDREGDIVDPFGVTVAADIPLFLYHDSTKTVGRASFGKPNSKGIPFEARIPKVAEPGILKDRVDEAWQMVKHGLITAVSIGFRTLGRAYEQIQDGGLKFLQTEVLELSLVPVPAQPAAVIQGFKSMGDDAKRAALIQQIKSIDSANKSAASGALPVDQQAAEKSASGHPPDKLPGVSGTPKQPARSGLFYVPKGKEMKTIQEQLAAFAAQREQKSARMAEIMAKAGDEMVTLDEAEDEEYETLKTEVSAIKKHEARLKEHEVLMVSKAVVVGEDSGKESRGGVEVRGGAQISVKSNLPKGIAFAQLVKCIGLAGPRNYMQAMAVAESKGASIDPRVARVLKAAVAAGSTSNDAWAGALVGDETSVYADFLEYQRPMTIVGKFGTNGIPSLRNVPFRVPLVGQTSGGSGYWTGEGQGKGLTKFDFSRRTLEPLKVANIAVLTMEALRDSNPSADAIIRDQLAAALAERMDIDFVDPNKGASSGISPASITNGVTPITSSGNDGDAVRADMKALFQPFISANNAPTSAVLIMSSSTALAASLMTNALGQSEFPNITMNGGTLRGIPVITSEYVKQNGSPTESPVILVNAQDIYLGDDGGFQVDVSTEASLQMDSTPTQNSIGTPTATSLVSMFQTNSVAFRAERTVNWLRRRDSAVAYLDDVHWGAA